MPSEYQKWLARDVKPEQPRELTPKEKRANWWYYHRGHVAIGLLIAALAVWFVSEVVYNRNNQPDCRIAYIGASRLPDDTILALETQMAALIGDINGNGKEQVQITQFTVDPNSEFYASSNAEEQMAMVTQLAVNENFLFLLEDPAAFQDHYGLLTLADGTSPKASGTEPLWYAWSQCPALAGLPLGEFAIDLGTGSPITGSNQALLTDLYIGRSALSDWSAEEQAAYSQAWQRILSQTP